MFISNLTDRGAGPALINTLVFNQARLKVIAENVANSNTPGYRAKSLDPRSFQAALRKALDERGGDPNKPLVIKDTGQVKTDRSGSLQVTPSETPVRNVLFHDGTNTSIEREMADLAETGMTQELASTLLRGRFDGLRKAIRGTVG
jgi:flagellar basal-body rod protein FlgB